MKMDGKLFLLNDAILRKNFFSWVTVADSEEVAKKYEASLTYYTKASKTVSEIKVFIFHFYIQL